MRSSSASKPPESTASDPGGFVHIPQLDGVRGLAILLILVHHSLAANPETSSRTIAFFTAVRGSLWVGVDLFFALSGFLITGILFDSVNGPRFLRNFYGRRALRIFPLYYLALFVVWLIGLPIAMRWGGYQWVLIAYLDNTRLWIGHAVPHHWWISPATSGPSPSKSSSTWPGRCSCCLCATAAALIAAALLLSAFALALRCFLVAHGAPREITYKLLPCRLDGLLLGGALALALRGPRRSSGFAVPPSSSWAAPPSCWSSPSANTASIGSTAASSTPSATRSPPPHPPR